MRQRPFGFIDDATGAFLYRHSGRIRDTFADWTHEQGRIDAGRCALSNVNPVAPGDVETQDVEVNAIYAIGQSNQRVGSVFRA
jgi:hypothetical protein